MADGDLTLNDNPNVDTGYVESGGTLHQVHLTRQLNGTLELNDDNYNVDTGYVTVNGKKHRVHLVADISSGGGVGGVTSVNGQTGAVTLGINDVAPTQTDKSGYVLGTDGFVAGWVKPEIVQRSALPQASEEEVGKIYQYIGTTDANYTNGYFYKCVSDGATPTPAYSWERIDVQPTLSTPSTMPTLLAASWSSNTQTISVTGVTASNIVFVSPAPSSAAEYGQCGIVCTAQATDSLTFTCTATPTNDLTVNVVIM